MNVIDVTGLEKSFGARKILDAVTFAIGEEERVGLIGVNGAGKSSLMKILAGLEDREGGAIAFRRGASVGYLSQDPVLDSASTVAGVIEEGLKEIRAAMTEFQELANSMSAGADDLDKMLARQGELSVWIEHHGGWNTDHRVNEIMGHLNLPDRDQVIGTLSGGTQRRVALARLLLEAPDLLLLDEPTNHLDADTTLWLQDYLRNYPGAVLLITHDRYFLDRIVNRMLELEDGAMFSYSGGYSSYLEQKEAKLLQAEQSRSRLLNLLRIETDWMRRGPKARTTKQKARIDRFHTLSDKSVAPVSRELKLEFSGDEPLGGTVLECIDLKKAYQEKQLFSGLTFRMKRGDRIGIIGANGCGKTTLLRTILGEVAADSGEVTVGRKTRIAYFDQAREILDPEQTIYDFLGEGDYVECGGVKRHKTGYLDDFLFHPSERLRRIRTLSGGERSRLILARLMLRDANLLLLDEPTNDLDIPTLQLLDDAVANFPGCVLVVTHDRFFLDKVATGILDFEKGGVVTFYEGNYTMYRELRDQGKQVAAGSDSDKKPAVSAGKPSQKASPGKKGLTYGERLELEQLETVIDELEARKAAVESMLADPAAFAGVAGGIAAISAEYSSLEQDLAGRYARWEELEMKKQ
jgi:ATP-binding cassette subfamily F protein uup